MLRSSAISRAAVVVALASLGGCEPFPGTESSRGSSGSSGSSGSASTRPAIDAQKLCSRLVDECRQPIDKSFCLRRYSAVRVTAACNSAIATASCADLGSSNGVSLASCFPRCTGKLASCNSDGTINICTTDGVVQVLDCQASCVVDGFSGWTGTCGTTFQGQTAVAPQCWCQ